MQWQQRNFLPAEIYRPIFRYRTSKSVSSLPQLSQYSCTGLKGFYWTMTNKRLTKIVDGCYTRMLRMALNINQYMMSPFIYVLGTKPWQNVLGTCSRYTSVHITSTVKCSRYPLRSDL